jgi:hypothetical protein
LYDLFNFFYNRLLTFIHNLELCSAISFEEKN